MNPFCHERKNPIVIENPLYFPIARDNIHPNRKIGMIEVVLEADFTLSYVGIIFSKDSLGIIHKVMMILNARR